MMVAWNTVATQRCLCLHSECFQRYSLETVGRIQDMSRKDESSTDPKCFARGHGRMAFTKTGHREASGIFWPGSWTLWGPIVMIGLTGFRIIMEANLWACKGLSRFG